MCVYCVVVQLCSDRCKTTPNNVFYGLQWGVECHCGGAGIDPTALGPTTCPMDCGGGEGKCGGNYATSTYQYNDPGAGVDDLLPEVVAGAEYLGCYRDLLKDRIMTSGLQERSGSMTAQAGFVFELFSRFRLRRVCCASPLGPVLCIPPLYIIPGIYRSFVDKKKCARTNKLQLCV